MSIYVCTRVIEQITFFFSLVDAVVFIYALSNLFDFFGQFKYSLINSPNRTKKKKKNINTTVGEKVVKRYDPDVGMFVG